MPRRGHQGEYLDANPLERAPDGEVKARWRDEGEWLLGSIFASCFGDLDIV